MNVYASDRFPTTKPVRVEANGETLSLAGRAYWDRVGERRIIDLDRNPAERHRVFDIIALKLGVRL